MRAAAALVCHFPADRSRKPRPAASTARREGSLTTSSAAANDSKLHPNGTTRRLRRRSQSKNAYCWRWRGDAIATNGKLSRPALLLTRSHSIHGASRICEYDRGENGWVVGRPAGRDHITLLACAYAR